MGEGINIRLYLVIFAFVLLVVISLIFISDYNRKKDINCFDKCVKEGYPVLDNTFPRSCELNNGTVLFEDIKYDLTCVKSPECIMIDRELRYSCCWADACEQPDYLDDKWIAVNKQSFDKGRDEFCPSQDSCGPRPACPQYEPINAYMQPICVNATCKKTNMRYG